MNTILVYLCCLHSFFSMRSSCGKKGSDILDNTVQSMVETIRAKDWETSVMDTSNCKEVGN